VRRMLTTIAVVAVSMVWTSTALADPGQTATDSTGTVQAAQPGLTADATAQAPTSADLNDGAASDPQATLNVETTPAAGGNQTADNSTGTIQIGGGGNQTATDSVGTAQVAEPAITGEASLGAPTTADVNDGVTTEPEAAATVTTPPGGGGDQTATDSVGTVQVGGGGEQTATDSTGTVQVGGPGPRALASAGPTESPQKAPPPLSEPSPTSVAVARETVGVLGRERTRQAKPQSGPAVLRAPAAAQLPFTGLPLWLALLVGAAALATGIALRRRWSPAEIA
jgi:hypothetical protein